MLNVQKINNFKVGFNNRGDTYTQKLGFINTLKIDGTWKNKASYDKWVDNTIAEEEYDNIPLEGFVINNNVGYMSYGDGREPKVRVLDPRGFEIELTMANFFHIISFGVDSGKALVGEYVYCYIDERLSLMNTKDPNYKDLVDTKVKPFINQELVIGNCYYTTLSPYKLSGWYDKKNENERYIFIGKYKIPTFNRFGLYVKDKETNIFLNRNFKNKDETYIFDGKITKSKIKSFEENIEEDQVVLKNIKLNVFSPDLLIFELINESKFGVHNDYRNSGYYEKFYYLDDFIIKNPTNNKLYFITLVKNDNFNLGQYYTNMITNNMEFLTKIKDCLWVYEIEAIDSFYKKILNKKLNISDILFSDSLVATTITTKTIEYGL